MDAKNKMIKCIHCGKEKEGFSIQDVLIIVEDYCPPRSCYEGDYWYDSHAYIDCSCGGHMYKFDLDFNYKGLLEYSHMFKKIKRKEAK